MTTEPARDVVLQWLRDHPQHTPGDCIAALWGDVDDDEFKRLSNRLRQMRHRLPKPKLRGGRPRKDGAPRPVVERDGLIIMVDDDRFRMADGETVETRSVRFRTLGCYPLSGAVESEANTIEKVVQEMLLATTSERQGRIIDRDAGDGSMEKKKQEGYF